MQVTAKLRALLNSTSEPSSPAPIIEKFLSGQNADAKALSEELTLLFRDFTHHTPFFISCVYALREKLPTTGDGSIIQEWWDMLLRPAFRDPTLPEEARIQAHAIVSRALDADVTEELVHKFHRRLVDLWVYELPNDVEACGMDETELVKVRCWSNNLCQILLRFGCDKPKEFLDTICAVSPSADSEQLQELLMAYVVHPDFSSAYIIAHHSIFDAIKMNTAAAPVVVVLIASLAVQCPDQLKETLLTQFLDVLIRMLKDDNSTSDTRPIFTILYYLFPCICINALRQEGLGIRDKVASLIRTHALHPQLVWSTAAEEASTSNDPWRGYNVSQILSESMVLDISEPESLSTPPTLITYAQPAPIEPDEEQNISDVILSLQSQLTRLRNELLLARWHQSHNRAHIMRLFEQTSMSRHSEYDWQAITNDIRTLREQKKIDAETIRLTTEKQERQRQHAKEWHDTLLAKNQYLRKQEKGWDTKRAELEATIEQQKQVHDAQAKLLSDAKDEVWELKTQRREVQHKIDRLKDYETELQKNREMQLTWADDFERYKAREDQVKELQMRCVQMHIMQASTEHAQAKLEESSRVCHTKLAITTSRLDEANRKIAQMAEYSAKFASANTAQAAESKRLKLQVKELNEKNIEMAENMTEMRAMVEMLQNRKGLVRSESRRSSPITPFREVTV